MIILAPAKLNLTFDIINKRADGYHNIRSVMQTVDVYDRLELEIGDRLEITGDEVSPLADNLIFKAVSALEEHCQRKFPCRIKLEKNIPIGAGMGGGSSDAAAVLLGLNALYGLGLDTAELKSVGLKIGADVPFLVQGGKCLVEGIGERVTPLEPDEGKFLYLIFRPRQSLSTKEAYDEYDRTGKSFAQMAREKCPQLERVFHFFKQAAISGKGPTTWVKRDYYDALFKNDKVLAVPSGLDSFLKDWDGNFFYARPVSGCYLNLALH